MACIINASTSNGLVNSADGSGQLKVQSNGVTTNALAWVNFNGTGTVAIRSSYNVSSITDNGTGLYSVNFTNALADANYSVCLSIGWAGSTVSSNSVAMVRDNLVAPSTSSFDMSTTFASNGTAYDVTRIFVQVFGN